MTAKLATCALVTTATLWAAVINERVALIPTSFAHVYACAAAIFVVFAAAIVSVNKNFQEVIKARPSDWHLVVFRSVPSVKGYGALLSMLSAFAYVLIAVGGNGSAPDWESASPESRSAFFAGMSIFAALSWLALSADKDAAA